MTTIKNLFKFLFFAAAIILSSCIDDVGDPVEYTPEREAAIIEEYLDSLTSNGYDVDTTGLGVYYAIVDQGDGEYVMPGDSIGIIYIGFFPESSYWFDSSSFYASNEDDIWKFTYMSTELIPGFENAISYLNEGTEGIFIVPSSQAYGPNGSSDGSIPPYSPLAFDIKLVEIYE